MKVRSIMKAELAKTSPKASCQEALDLLRAHGSPYLVVTPISGGWAFVTESELEDRIAERDALDSGCTVAEVMRSPAVTVHPDESVDVASELMGQHGLSHLLVVENGEPAGIVSESDIAKALRLLADHPIFAGLSREAIAALSKVAFFRDVAAGTVLLTEGEETGDIFVLDRGELTVHTRQAGRIARIGPGEMVGELEIFGGQNAATVRASRESRVLAIDRARFLLLIAGNQAMAATLYANIIELMGGRLREANRFLFLRGIARHRMLVLRILAAAGLVLILFTLGFGFASEYPSFCTTCHYMQPYYDSWAVSPHRDVRCVECHYSYGFKGVLRGKVTGLAMVTRYATRTYDPKPEAEVSDSSCMRAGCHGSTPATLAMVSSPGIRFSHQAHQDTLGMGSALRCTSCHEHGRQHDHFSVANDVCFLCHFMDPAADDEKSNCRSCHTFDPGETEPTRINHVAMPHRIDCRYCHDGMEKGDGQVEEYRCYSCHLEPRDVGAGELHRIHIEERDVSCFECHGQIRHEGGTGRILAQNCDACHRDEHSPQELIYLGRGGRGVIDTPGAMSYFHVECTGCHRPDADVVAPDMPAGGSHLATATEENCLSCHDLDYRDKLRMWTTTIDSVMAEARKTRDTVEEALARAANESDPSWPRILQLYEDAAYNIDLVAADRSRGAHNFKYTLELIKAARSDLGRALAVLRAGELPRDPER